MTLSSSAQRSVLCYLGIGHHVLLARHLAPTFSGIWSAGTYSIAKREEETANNALERIVIPAGQYAVFRTGQGGFAGDELPKLRAQIFDAWLADSGYEQISDYEVEVYHLLPRTERHRRSYEIWIPVEEKHAAEHE